MIALNARIEGCPSLTILLVWPSAQHCRCRGRGLYAAATDGQDRSPTGGARPASAALFPMEPAARTGGCANLRQARCWPDFWARSATGQNPAARTMPCTDSARQGQHDDAAPVLPALRPRPNGLSAPRNVDMLPAGEALGGNFVVKNRMICSGNADVSRGEQRLHANLRPHFA